MCWCNPSISLPVCGSSDCVAPKRNWFEQIKHSPERLWTGDFSICNLADTNSNNGAELIRYFKTKNELIDAMILRLESLKEVMP